MGTMTLRVGHRIIIGGKPALVANISNNGLVAYIRYQDGRMEKIVLQDIAVKHVPRMVRRREIRDKFKAALKVRR